MRKKLLSLTLAVCIALSLFAGMTFTVSANTEGYYTYTVSNGKAIITYVDDSIRGNVIIPSILGGYTVTAIGEDAFEECVNLTNIDIPDTVVSIGSGAFSDCTGLTSVKLSNSITEIDNWAFDGCSALTSVHIPESIERIGWNAFRNCTSMTVLDLPNTLTEIGGGICSGCTSLETISIPDSVTIIGEDAFEDCSGLKNLSIPHSVDEIGQRAFSNCSGIETITVQKGNEKYISKNNCLIERSGGVLVLGCKNSIIPTDNSVRKIGDWAFQGCTGLKSIDFPDTVSAIGLYSFNGCTGLENLTIPYSISEIGDGAFWECSASLVSIKANGFNKNYQTNGNCLIETNTKVLLLGCKNSIIPNDGSIRAIDTCAFAGCVGLTKITIPDSVTLIGGWAFSGCTGLINITIPNSVKEISWFTFSDCSKLTNIIIPNAITEIGHYAFYGCTRLKNVYYSGTERQAYYISIDDGNISLTNATWHYNSTGSNIGNFPDVNLKDWYGKAVSYAVSAGLMKGYASGKFGTADGIQRQDFVVILSRLSGDDLGKYSDQKAFKDVSKGAYYAAALAWAKDKGVSSGYANGKFGVGDKVTREQIMVFLYNYAKLKGYDTTATMTEAQAKATYADFGKVSGYAKEAALWALSKGVVSGKDAGGGKKLIAPQANALRCEVAAMFYNIEQKDIFKK